MNMHESNVAEKLAQLLLKSVEEVSKENCPLYDFLSNPFIERVLWLEDLSKSQLKDFVKHCEMCKMFKICYPDDSFGNRDKIKKPPKK
jgi:hypothetical protein